MWGGYRRVEVRNPAYESFPHVCGGYLYLLINEAMLRWCEGIVNLESKKTGIVPVFLRFEVF